MRPLKDSLVKSAFLFNRRIYLHFIQKYVILSLSFLDTHKIDNDFLLFHSKFLSRSWVMQSLKDSLVISAFLFNRRIYLHFIQKYVILSLSFLDTHKIDNDF